MTDGYITHCVECGRELAEFEGDICDSCWALDYEDDEEDDEEDDDAYDDYYEYDEYYEYYEPQEPPTRWQRFKNWLNRLYWKVRYRWMPVPDDIPF